MTPKGILAYAAGLLLLCGGLGLFLLAPVSLFAFAPRVATDAGIVLVFIPLIVFAAGHLLAAGLYRMLTHLYRAISRTDPASDRPLRGRTVYLLGQIGCAMAVPVVALFLLLALTDVPNRGREQGLWLGALAGGFLLTATATTFFAGLGLMVRDLFLRHRDIVDAHQAERRRLAEREELPTEVLAPRPADALREHVREERR